jgi:hypothetical protein
MQVEMNHDGTTSFVNSAVASVPADVYSRTLLVSTGAGGVGQWWVNGGRSGPPLNGVPRLAQSTSQFDLIICTDPHTDALDYSFTGSIARVVVWNRALWDSDASAVTGSAPFAYMAGVSAAASPAHDISWPRRDDLRLAGAAGQPAEDASGRVRRAAVNSTMVTLFGAAVAVNLFGRRRRK